jgi:hypothetical protein
MILNKGAKITVILLAMAAVVVYIGFILMMRSAGS